MFFESFEPIERVLAVGVPAYLILVLFLRVTGKRTLSQMNAFDLIITVALGSTLSTILVSSEVALAEGTVVLGLLVALQYAITWTSVRVPAFQRVIKATPRLVAFRGRLLPDAMRSERVTEEEIEVAVRKHGLPAIGRAWAVVIETDGTLTVVPRREDADGYAVLEHVRGPE